MEVESCSTKRKRDEEEGPTGFSKRKREITQQQQLDVPSILERVVHWLVSHPSQHPRSLSSLSRAIAKLCTAIIYISEEIIFYQLLFNGLVEFHYLPSGEKLVKGTANPKPFEEMIGFFVEVGAGPASVQFSDDFCLALRRARDWVATNSGLHETLIPYDSFLRSLKQLCQFKRSVPPSVVLECMVKRGLIEVSADAEKVTYHHAALGVADAKMKYVVEDE